MMRRVGDLVTGRRAKWVVAAVWLLLMVALSGPSQNLADETDDSTESFLPRSAESKDVLATIEEKFPEGDTENAIVVYHRNGGLTAEDRKQIAADAKALEGLDTSLGTGTVPFEGKLGKQAVSPDGATAFSTLLYQGGDQEKLADEGEAAEKALGTPPEGLEVYLTGSLGFAKDSAEVFEGLDTTLVLATATLVLVLLLLIYRSPLIAITPLLVVFFSYTVATAVAYFLAKGGMHVDSQGTSILAVLMFGAGTDYCLLLVSRYREELRRQQDKHLAMARAVRRAGPAILASGLTVVGALLVMLTADLGSTRSLGPIGAIGVFTVMVASLTLLPSLLVIWGRRGFWPRRRLVEFDPDHEIEERSLWRRFGLRVVQRPGLALLGSSAVLAVFCLGLLAYKEDFNINSFFRNPPESVDGFKLIQQNFPAGFLDATTLLVEKPGGLVSEGDEQRAQQIVSGVDGVAAVTPVDSSPDRSVKRLAIVFEKDPYALDTLDLIPEIRSDLASGLPPGVDGRLGDATAIQYDYSQATESDLKRLAPLVLLVIFVILVVLLRALIAPLYLIATVIFSLFATLGVTAFVFVEIVGDAGFDTSLPTYAFIFLVALGVDYNIFLMSRVREEARTCDTREAVVRALAATGPVITSAGIILAGTFGVLATLPVTFLLHLGFAVAVGVLIDTFIVRTIMVPAIAELVGDFSWWPSGRKAKGLVGAGEPEPAPARE